MSISEIRCYHNGCPKRKFFNFLPIDHIFVYATLGPTNTIYAATGYCILKEKHTLVPSSVESEFIKIAAKLSPIRVFLKGEEKPKYWKSLNALAFKYEIEMRNGEKKEEIVLSFYLALRKKCLFEPENISEIKVLRKDEEKTEEAVFLKSLDVGLIEEAIEQLRSINVYVIEETIEQLRSTNVYQGIHSKDITEEYEEEKTPINKFKRTTSSKQKQDLLEFFDVFLLPSAYPTESLGKELERIKSEEEQPEKKYKKIQKKLRQKKLRSIIRSEGTSEDQNDYIKIRASIERFHTLFLMVWKKLDEEPENMPTQSNLSNILRNFYKALMEAEEFLSKWERNDEYY